MDSHKRKEGRRRLFQDLSKNLTGKLFYLGVFGAVYFSSDKADRDPLIGFVYFVMFILFVDVLIRWFGVLVTVLIYMLGGAILLVLQLIYETSIYGSSGF